MYMNTSNMHVREEPTARQDKMRDLVLTRDRFAVLKSAVDATLNEFLAIMESDKESKKIDRVSTVLERLDTLDKDKWKRIRMDYLSDPYYGYTSGNFTDSEMSDPSKLLLDLVNSCGQIQETIRTKVHDLYENDKEHRSEVRKLQAQLKSLTALHKEAEFRSETAKEEVATSREQILTLQKEMSEKRDTINRLSRDGTVQIWQKEKERVLADSALRIQQLEKDKVKLEADNDRMRRIMDKKLTMVGEQNKMLKMKQELATAKMEKSGHAENPDTNKLKNENYLLQKDLLVLEKELQRVQVVFAGVLNGIRKEMMILVNKYKIKSYGEVLDMDMATISERIESIYKQSLNGKLWTESERLHPLYKNLDDSVTTTKTKKLSAFGRSARLSPIEQQVKNENLKDLHNKMSKASICANPQIADPSSGFINSTQAMRHFPAISQDSVKEHWEQFQRFDSDGNNALDFPEVLRAMQTTIGFQFTPTQIENSFHEVDENKSGSIDFYEYLKITQLLIDRNGYSEIFQSGVAKTKSTVISKTCAIQ